jgi:glycine/D-amino acid oxidase-like deaminating enzyme
MDELPAAAAIVIVGGGFAGAATAWWLARAGATEVVIVEREAICGAHASGKNAAICRQIADDDDTTALTVRGAGFLRAPPAGFSDVPLLHRTGGFLCTDTPADGELLAARARHHDVRCHWMTAAEAARRWPGLAGMHDRSGLFFDDDGVIDVGAVLAGYLDGARRAGVRVVTGCEVEAIEAGATGAAGAVLRTSRGTIRAARVVCAAGAWAGEVGARAGVTAAFEPVKRHLFVAAHGPAVARAQPYVWHLGAQPFYVRPEGTGVLLSHCDGRIVAPAEVPPDDDAADRLAERIRAVAPELIGAQVKRTWACLRTFTPAHRMRIGWDDHRPWLYWVAGLMGHGATASPAVGERAAAELLRAT